MTVRNNAAHGTSKLDEQLAPKQLATGEHQNRVVSPDEAMRSMHDGPPLNKHHDQVT